MKALKWFTVLLEIVLAIPFLGHSILNNHWILSVGLIVLHGLVFIKLKNTGVPRYGNLTAALLALPGAIPVIGWIIHGVVALWLLIEALIGLISGGKQKNIRYN